MRRVLPCHSPTAIPAGSCRTQLPLCHISMRGGAGLSRLSPLRVGCLRLAPIGTRFCFLLVLYPRKPVQLVLRMSTGSGADGRIRTCDFPSSRFTLRSDPLPRLRYICIEGGCSSFRAASQSCDGAQALLRQQSFKRSRTHLLEGELNGLAFGHVSMCPQLQHRGLRGLLQDFASPIRLSR